MRRQIHILALLLVGCENVDLSNISQEDVDKVIVCNTPYMRFGSSCCLDDNDNGICDNDEGTKEEIVKEEVEESEETCTNKCSSDSCDGEEYIACLEQSDGCKDKVNKGKIIGKCGVKCISNNDCGSNQECLSNECKKIELSCSDECSSDRCSDQTFVACNMQNDGCKDEEWVGFVKGKCGVECTYESDCEPEERCLGLVCQTVEETNEVDGNNLDCSSFTAGGVITVYVYDSLTLIGNYNIEINPLSGDPNARGDIVVDNFMTGDRARFCARGGWTYDITISKEGYIQKTTKVSTYQIVEQDVSIFLESEATE